jgi:hypothetical protein
MVAAAGIGIAGPVNLNIYRECFIGLDPEITGIVYQFEVTFVGFCYRVEVYHQASAAGTGPGVIPGDHRLRHVSVILIAGAY